MRRFMAFLGVTPHRRRRRHAAAPSSTARVAGSAPLGSARGPPDRAPGDARLAPAGRRVHGRRHRVRRPVHVPGHLDRVRRRVRDQPDAGGHALDDVPARHRAGQPAPRPRLRRVRRPRPADGVDGPARRGLAGGLPRAATSRWSSSPTRCSWRSASSSRSSARRPRSRDAMPGCPDSRSGSPTPVPASASPIALPVAGRAHPDGRLARDRARVHGIEPRRRRLRLDDDQRTGHRRPGAGAGAGVVTRRRRRRPREAPDPIRAAATASR